MKNKLTSAIFHDSQVFNHVITGVEKAVYADKAYGSQKIINHLQSLDIKPRIIRRKKKGQALSHLQAKLNKGYSKIRCHVERVFAHWKVLSGYIKARYCGWDKNQRHLDLLSISYNLKRAASLTQKRLMRENYV